MSVDMQISFSDISEVYLQELRRGNRVDPRSLAKRFPQHAERILRELPAMAMLEQGLRSPAPTETPDLGIPNIPGYELGELIGRGATGSVHKAKHLASGKLCAIKLVDVTSGVDPLRLDREIESLQRLDHPNIASIESFGTVADTVYIVMNLIEGCSLAQIIRGSGSVHASYWATELSRDFTRIALWGREIASALDYMHGKHILHRDIKPANLIVDRTGKCWLTDFGLAKVCERGMTVSRTGQIVGTPRYMPPEQMRGAVDHRSDIFSLGRTLYELATVGCPSNPTEAAVELPDIRSISPEFPVELAKIITKASEHSPEKRFQTAQELVAVLDRFLVGKRPSDRRRPGKRLTEVQFKSAMRRQYRLATVACVCAMGATVTYMLIPSGRSSSVDTLRRTPTPTVAEPESFKNLAAAIEDRDSGFVEVIGEAIKGSVVQHADGPEANRIGERIDQIVNKVSTEGLKPGELDTLIQSYRQSSLMLANKVMALHNPLQYTGLPSAEKLRGSQILTLFAKATVNKRIETHEAERMLAALFQGQVPRLEEMVNVRIPDRIFGAWLNLVESNFAAEFSSIAAEPFQFNAEVNQIIDSYLDRPQ